MSPVKTPLAERFWSHVAVTSPDDCWEWIAARLPKGYGLTSDDQRRRRYAHRVSWEMTHGPIPDGLFVLHHCDNPPCVNPAHLFLGDQHDNHVDMVLKRRHTFGDRSAVAKITDAQAVDIRRRHAAGESARALGVEFGLHCHTIRKIARGVYRRHLAHATGAEVGT